MILSAGNLWTINDQLTIFSAFSTTFISSWRSEMEDVSLCQYQLYCIVLYCTVLHCPGDVARDEVFLREEGEEHLVAFLVSSVSSRHSEVLHTYRCLHILLRHPDVHVSHEVEGVLIEAEYEANTCSDSQHSVEREEVFERKRERH